MQRIRQRKYGRDGSSPYATGATHVIKIAYYVVPALLWGPEP